MVYRHLDPGVEQIFGYSEEEWIGQDVEIIFTPEDGASGIPEAELQGIHENDRAPDVRWHVRKSGKRIFVDGAMVALRSPDGELLGFSKSAAM